MILTAKKLQDFVLPYAFGAALVRILIDVLTKMANGDPLLYYFTFLLCFVLEASFIVYVTRLYKAQNENSLTLQEGLKIGLIIMLVLGFSYSSASYFYDTQIDPEFQSNTLLSLVKKYNPALIEQTEKQIELSKQNTSFLGIFTSTIWFIIVGFIISIVSANFLKSSK